METLPHEIVEKLSRYLSTQDLARSCAVSSKWRNIFDQDCLWKPHCDPTLEEPLRTIPSVVEPVFVSTEDENSTLRTISKWRLAFMRENHLWRNYKRNTYKTHSPEIYNDAFLFTFPFLSDTLIVNWRSKNIEIWDVSVIPAILVAETDPSVDIGNRNSCYVLGNNMLLVEKRTSLQVFLVDVEKSSIKLKDEIFLEDEPKFWRYSDPIVVDGCIFCARDTAGLTTLTIFELGEGKKIVEVPCPVLENNDGNMKIAEISSSPTNDNLLVALYDGRNTSHYYIFSLKHQLYLPGPIAELPGSPYLYYYSINKRHVALCGRSFLKIIDYHTSEVIFENEDEFYEPLAYNNSFIFLERSDKLRLKIFSGETKTLITFFEREFEEPDEEYDESIGQFELKIENDRILFLFNDNGLNAVFDLSSEMPEEINVSVNMPFNLTEQINSSFTRITSTADVCGNESVRIYYYW